MRPIFIFTSGIRAASAALRHWFLPLLLLLAGAHTAHAAVVSGNYGLGGDRSGFAGDEVSLMVHEPSLSGFAGAQLSFSYDSTKLTFKDALTGPYGVASAVPFSDVGGIATYSLFLFLTSALDINGPLDLFTLVFDINMTAPPGDTLVAFTNFLSPADLSDPFNAGLYDRQAFEGTITILAVPIIGTLPLFLTGLGLTALAQRRRRTRQSATGIGHH